MMKQELEQVQVYRQGEKTSALEKGCQQTQRAWKQGHKTLASAAEQPH